MAAPGRALRPNQRSELLEHLGRVFGDDAAGAVADRIAVAYERAAFMAITEPWLRSLRAPEAKTFRAHHHKIAQTARELLALLDWQEPHGPMSTLTSRTGYSLGWDTLRAHTELLIQEATAEAKTYTPARRGRSRERWRDALILAVREAYAGAATTTRGGHFEQTVEMLLKWIEGAAPADMHDAIMRALRVEKKARAAAE